MKLSKKQRKKYLRSSISMGLITLSTAMSFVTPVLNLTVRADENKAVTISNKESEVKKKTAKEKQTAPYRNVMYYGDWSVWGGQGNQYPKDLPAGDYTHLNYAFLDFDKNGDLVLTDKDAAFGNPVGSQNTWGDTLSGAIPALAALREQNPNMKLGFSLGGWSKSGDFSTVASDATKRQHFVDNVLQFVNYTGMDFVDVDWEFPNIPRQADLVDNKNDEGTPDANTNDGKNYILLMQDLRNALDKQGEKDGKTYELSVALPGTKKQLEQSGVDLKQLFSIIDFGNMMTYDTNGAWGDTSGHQTALYTNPEDPTGFSIDAVVKYLQSQDVQMDKVVIGAAYYTRGWESVEKGSDSKQPGLFQKAAIEGTDADQTPSRGAANEQPLKSGEGGRRSGLWSYRNLDTLKKNDPSLKEYWDDVAKAPYLYSEKTKDFYTYDNVQSVKEKAKYVKENHLGGMISWQSSEDKDTDGDNVRDELTNAISDELHGDVALPDVIEDVDNPLNIDLSIEKGKADSGSDSYNFSITNKENLETYNSDALQFADSYFSTVKKAQFVITTKDGSTLKSGDWKAGTVTTKDGKTIVDLSSVYDAKFIKPGMSYSFKLVSDSGKPVDTDNIQTVELQQYYDKDTMLSSQTILGEHNENPENKKPVLSGIKDQTITLGTKFDPMKSVSASDPEDGDLTNKINVSGTVNTAKEGTYKLKYSVTDSKGATTEAERTITVVKESDPEIKGISDKTIFEKDSFDPLEGVSAVDGNGVDITDSIEVEGKVDVNKAGTYKLTYTATTNNGKKVTKERTVTVKKETAPVFSGLENVEVKKGTAFDSMKDVTATDGRGNSISKENIIVTGNVDTNKEGTYTLTYKATANSGMTTTKERTVTVLPADTSVPSDDAEKMVNPKNQVMVGYWHNWASKNDGYKQGTAQAMNLTEINDDYNVIDVSFMKASEGSNIPVFKPYNQTDEEFRAQVGKLNKEGRSVLLALGGADAHIELKQSDEDAFIAAVIKQVDTYGFDGIDLDLEQSAITAADNQKVIPSALKKVKAHYASEGKNFLITMAPEFPYLKANGPYAEYINNLDGQYDWINPQYYNQGGDGVSGENGQWLAQNNDDKKEDFLYYLTTALINGTDGYSNYVKIPADKMVIGLPSNPDAAGSGYVKTPESVKNAMNRLEKDNHEIKGLMTWSVNWDNGLDSNGNKYNWAFVKSYKDLIDYDDNEETQNQKPVINGATDKTLTIGESFDPLTGVTAQDKEDGDLTSNITVSGTVDTQKAGTYTLTYSVKDSEGQQTSVDRKITVNEEATEEKPVFKGVSNVELNVGDSFDPKAGVSAVDGKGNDVTANITFTSNVDTTKAGSYEVNYTVVSKSGKATATAKRLVIVKEKGNTDPSNDEWSATKIYTGGEIVTYKGKQYKAKWWTQGDKPDESGAYGPWEELSDPSDPSSSEWSDGKIYVADDIVTYQGTKYKAKWWTQGDVPGKSDVWAKQ